MKQTLFPSTINSKEKIEEEFSNIDLKEGDSAYIFYCKSQLQKYLSTEQWKVNKTNGCISISNKIFREKFEAVDSNLASKLKFQIWMKRPEKERTTLQVEVAGAGPEYKKLKLELSNSLKSRLPYDKDFILGKETEGIVMTLKMKALGIVNKIDDTTDKLSLNNEAIKDSVKKFIGYLDMNIINEWIVNDSVPIINAYKYKIESSLVEELDEQILDNSFIVTTKDMINQSRKDEDSEATKLVSETQKEIIISEYNKAVVDEQEERDKKYPREFVSEIGVKTKQWLELLQNPEVFKEKDIELIKKIYRADNHAISCYELGIQDGVYPSAYIQPIVALGRRISAALSLSPVLGNDGKETWWRIPFWGSYQENGHFEWKLRPKLAKAMERMFPELEMEGINEEQDNKLVEELKKVNLKNAQADFEYKGESKKKQETVYSNGHKTYTRDRQTALNALVHAHYLCEIDGEHPTFLRKKCDKNYTEPHHLVPMAYSDKFNVSLDVEENIVSLCSNCHNQLHYGKGTEVLLEKLYDERKEHLARVDIKISLEELLEMYL